VPKYAIKAGSKSHNNPLIRKNKNPAMPNPLSQFLTLGDNIAGNNLLLNLNKEYFNIRKFLQV